MTKYLFLSLFLLVPCSNAKAILPGGCTPLPVPGATTILVVLAAYEGVKAAHKAFWMYCAATKKANETKGN